MKDEIMKYIKDHFRRVHFSYCHYPESECSCKDLSLIDENTQLVKEGFLDSFSLVVLLVWLENRFNVKIPEKDATVDNFETVNGMINEISRHRR